MNKRLRGLLCLVLLLGVLGPGLPRPMAAAPVAPVESGVYEEGFNTYDFLSTVETASWNIFSGNLSIRPQGGHPRCNTRIVSFDDGTFVAVWEDYRNGYICPVVQKYDAEGNPLWKNDIPASQIGGTLTQIQPDIAVDSSGDIVVTWEDSRNGNQDIFAQKLNNDGEFLWATDVQVNTDGGSAYQYGASTVIDQSGNVLIAWSDYRNGNWDVFVHKLDGAGNPLWVSETQVNTESEITSQSNSAIAVNENGVSTVVWSDNRDGYDVIYAQRLNAAGTKLWTSAVQVSSDSRNARCNAAVTVDAASNSIVVWEDERNGSTNRAIYGQKLNSDGIKQWGNDIQISSNSASGRQNDPVVTTGFNNNVIVVWSGDFSNTNNYRVYMQKLSSLGVALYSSYGLRIDSEETSQYSPGLALAPDGSVLIVWDGYYYGYRINLVQKFDTLGSTQWPLAKILLRGKGTVTQLAPKIVFLKDGSSVVAWYDGRDQGIYIQRTNLDGSLNFDSIIRVNQVAAHSGFRLGLAAYSNGDVIVTWWGTQNEQKGIYAQRLDLNGNRLWHQDIHVNLGGSMGWILSFIAVDTTANGDAVVTWTDAPSPGGDYDVYIQRLDSTGTHRWASDVRVNAVVGACSPYGPDIATGKTDNAMVVWASEGNIYGQKFDLLGNRLWSQDVMVNAADGTVTKYKWFSSVEMDSNGYAVITWEVNSNVEDGNYAIYAQRLSPTGVRQWQSDVRVSTNTDRKEYPAVAVDESDHAVILWTDFRDGYSSDLSSGYGDIYGQRLDVNGNRVWADDIQVHDSIPLQGQWYPTLSVSGDNMFIAWEDWRNDNADVYLQTLGTNGDRMWSSDLQLVNPDYFYFPSGWAESRPVDDIADTITQANLTANYELNGGSGAFYLTNNGGANWAPVTPGVTHVFTTTGSDLRWKAVLTSDLLWPRTPVIDSLRIEYSTQMPYADDYEPDDTCAQARPLAVNGAVQAHTFHQQADADWAWFDVISGTTYIVQTSNTQANADTAMELRAACPQPPFASDDNVFGNDARITWRASFSGSIYVKVSHHDPAVYGAETGYDLSVRTFIQPPVVVIVAGHDDRYSLQSNIDAMADMAYRTFLNSGVPKHNIRYFGPNPARDVDGNGLNDDLYATVTITGVREAVQNWSREQGVQLGVPFYVYLVDHGHYDQFLAAGNANKIWAADLNLWLSNLEATSGADHINVILEACKSGSFIDVTTLGPAYISGHNRVVIASTSSTLNAYPSPQGGHFSDGFWTAVGQNQDLKTAFEWAKQAVQVTGLSQQPWLDDNGDAVADGRDGALARGRGLGGAFAGSPPVIDWAMVEDTGGQASIQAQVRDDFGVELVWAEVYAPDFVEPEPSQDGTTPEVNAPTTTLTLAGSDLYGATYPLTQTGNYRLVVYALDDEGNRALPQAVRLCAGCTFVYLPLVLR